MVSKYVITFDSLTLGGKPENYNKNFKLISENQLLHEDEGNIGFSEGERLKLLLGRNPYE